MSNNKQAAYLSIFIGIAILVAAVFQGGFSKPSDVAARLLVSTHAPGMAAQAASAVEGVLRQGETFGVLLSRHGIPSTVVQAVNEAAGKMLNLRSLRAGNPYSIVLSRDGLLDKFEYTADEFKKIFIYRDPKNPDRFISEKVPIPYEVKRSVVRGTIESHLVGSLSHTPEPNRLAIELSEIFAWDIDFTTDLKRGDTYEMYVEERWSGGEFKRYGKILAAKFVNNGTTFTAWHFDDGNGTAGYYDDNGRPLKRGFLISPLRFKYISSRFSASRMHPILKTPRPHLGVDYAAPEGTPVSAASDATVHFAGVRGGFGNLVILSHPSGYETYYGHLAHFADGIRSGTRVSQGQVIGYVGSTGMSTGPHLDYRVSQRGRFVNPLKLKAMKAEPITGETLAVFKKQSGKLASEFRQTALASAASKASPIH
ncbi:MAG: M23 family metallopeptidase [Nitrospirae bacterium]|nr:M23 family metallopeptidase [Nitrospirota bacterium]